MLPFLKKSTFLCNGVPVIPGTPGIPGRDGYGAHLVQKESVDRDILRLQARCLSKTGKSVLGRTFTVANKTA